LNINKDTWTEVIRPKSNLFDLKIKEVIRYRDLLYLFVKRDFVTQYKQTILGPSWHLIQPLFTTGVFTIIFGMVAKIPTDGMPPFLFYMCGNIIWGFFSGIMVSTSGTFVANAGIFGKVYFPRLISPLSTVSSQCISLLLRLILLVIILCMFMFKTDVVRPNLMLLVVPLVVLMMAGIGLGIGIIVSSLTTRYRDLGIVVNFAASLLMYATPVIYPLSVVQEKYRIIALINPIAPLVETFRYAFLGAGTVSWLHISYSAIFTVVILCLGILLFNRIERTFMDVV
tara:strand:- start:457 stop:1308 length:852 start_codon:yes stop_codon:yes gene_type:complete